ncbi:hypothetical protein GCM10022200_00150 [Microbacterium awajiense]|uniref:Uncharacterized protein n=1 Tax=Microbacterium awajiense TaxID=415214 RepID=A0ABP7A091_9MICO
MAAPPSLRPLLRAGVALALAGSVALAASACRPEPAPSASGARTSTATPLPTGVTPSPVETMRPDAFALPSACELAYSAPMFAELETAVAPLNDPGITMFSTQQPALLELLDSGIPSLRCTWGGPSEYGIATTITEVDSAQAAAVEADLRANGFGCAEHAGGVLCVIEQRGITQDDLEYVSGESHFVGDGGWVATTYLNAEVEGYTEDIVATLWG